MNRRDYLVMYQYTIVEQIVEAYRGLQPSEYIQHLQEKYRRVERILTKLDARHRESKLCNINDIQVWDEEGIE